MLKQVSLQMDWPNEMQKVASNCGARLNVVDCRDFNSKGMTMLLEIHGNGQSMQRAITGLRGIEGTRHVYASETGDSKSLCVAVLDRPALCQASLAANVICLCCPYNTADQRPKWDFLVRSSDDLRKLLGELESIGINATIMDVSDAKREDSLTPRQKEVLSKAISLGFFEFPRRIDLTELSEAVGIKPSTLSEILRSAERKIMANVGRELGVPQSHSEVTTEAF